jgi:hypothetical protein
LILLAGRGRGTVEDKVTGRRESGGRSDQQKMLFGELRRYVLVVDADVVLGSKELLVVVEERGNGDRSVDVCRESANGHPLPHSVSNGIEKRGLRTCNGLAITNFYKFYVTLVVLDVLGGGK